MGIFILVVGLWLYCGSLGGSSSSPSRVKRWESRCRLPIATPISNQPRQDVATGDRNPPHISAYQLVICRDQATQTTRLTQNYSWQS